MIYYVLYPHWILYSYWSSLDVILNTVHFIFIFEDGIPYQGERVTDDDIKACEDGLLDIIYVKDMTQLSHGAWVPLDIWETGA